MREEPVELVILMRKIEENDPEILSELAEIILEHREKKIKGPKLNTIQVTARDIKTMSKAIRENVKK